MPPGFPRGRPNRAEVVSGLARICGRRAHEERDVAGEVARSSAAPLLALAEAGPGFPSMAVFGFRFVAEEHTLSAPCRFRGWAAPGCLVRPGTPSFRGIRLEFESPLNIRAGSHPLRKGTGLNERFAMYARDDRGRGAFSFEHGPSSDFPADNAARPRVPAWPVKSAER